MTSIKDMQNFDIHDIIRHSHMGRLAYIHEGRPEITPMSFRFSGGSLYSFTTEGQKTEAMRKNNAICILFDRIESSTEWTTVVVHGRYHEIEDEGEKETIANMLSSEPNWWEPGYTKTITATGAQRELKPVFFRVDIESVTGHHTE